MKITFFLLLATFMSVSASSLAQKVTLNTTNANLKMVLKDIKKQTGYSFIIDEQLLDNAKTVTLHLNNTGINAALDQLFENQPLTFTIEDKVVTIKEKKPSFLDKLKSSLNLDKIDVHGRVVNENGEPLSGATVTVRGVNQSTSTDANGYFYLSDVNQDATIAISYIGYNKQELKAIKDLGTVKLVVTSNSLDQVQVIAYGTTTERLNTGDVTTIKSSDIEKAPVDNVLAAIEGKVSGLLVNQNNGMPNSSFSVQIRGQNSISNGNDLLYVIDGVPYTSELVASSTLNPAGGNPLNFINPADIESISILKDADATSIYGSRAANGAMLITTKKGKAGKLKLDINASQGMAQAPLTAQFLNTPEYLAMRQEAFKNDGAQPNQYNAPDLLVWDTTRYTNWEKYLIGRTAQYNNISANLSGGNNNTQYLFGATYHDQSTVFPSSDADQKVSLHFNLASSSDDQKFKFNLTANYMVDNSNLPDYDLTSFINTPPDAPSVYNSNGSLNWANSTFQNPLALSLARYTATTNNIVSNALLSYNLIKGLFIRSSFGYTNLQSNEFSSLPIAGQNPAYSPTGSSMFGNNNIHSWTVEPQLSYSLSVKKSHVEALVGSTFEENSTNGQSLGAQGYTSDALLESIQAAPRVLIGSISNIIYKYSALFGRVNYNYDDKYLINVNWRRDGSSRFGPADEFHNFASVGGAWIFTKEDFFKKDNNILSFGKLRASYGTTGSDQIGDYRFYNLYQSGYSQYQGTTGLTPTGFYNPNLEWELTKKLEGGLELGFLKDRILLQVNYYADRSSNQLLSSPLPSITGFTSIPINFPATVQNSGWEFMLNTTNISSKDFKWKTSFNLTANQNKLVAFPGLSDNPNFENSYVIGQPITVVRVFHSLGVDPQTGVYEFEDSQGKPTFNPSFPTDATSFVNLAPKFYGGFQDSFIYKAWQLDIFFQFRKQMGRNPLFSLFAPPGFEANDLTAVLNRWQSPGDKATVEQLTERFGSNPFNAYQYAQQSDLAYVDASFIRLSNLSLSYQLPGDWLKKFGVHGVQIYVHGQNLLTITKYKGLDPETQNMGGLPVLRVITVGIHLSL